MLQPSWPVHLQGKPRCVRAMAQTVAFQPSPSWATLRSWETEIARAKCNVNQSEDLPHVGLGKEKGDFPIVRAREEKQWTGMIFGGRSVDETCGATSLNQSR